MLILCVSVSGFPDPSTQHVYMYIFSMHFTLVFIGNEYMYDAQESNLPVYYVVQTHYTCTASVCMKSKFHNGILQVREPSSLQASNGMVVRSYAGESSNTKQSLSSS